MIAGPDALVSVVVPCYNQAHFLPEAIESILGQTHPKIEVVVVDDGSADNTAAVVARYPGVRLTRQTNQGLAAARDAGLAEASGEFVVFLDADDWLLPNALTVGITAFARNDAAAFVFGSTMFAMEDGSEPPPPHRPQMGESPYRALLAGCPIMSIASVMFRRSLFDEVAPFDPSLRAAEDYELYYRVARRRTICPHGEVVTVYRRHGMNMTGGSVRGLLRGNLRALHRERWYVWCRPQYWSSYRSGTRYWRLHYGSRLVAEVQRSLLEHQWRLAARGCSTLLRWWPRGLLEVASSRRRIRALPEWAPDT